MLTGDEDEEEGGRGGGSAGAGGGAAAEGGGSRGAGLGEGTGAEEGRAGAAPPLQPPPGIHTSSASSCWRWHSGAEVAQWRGLGRGASGGAAASLKAGWPCRALGGGAGRGCSGRLSPAIPSSSHTSHSLHPLRSPVPPTCARRSLQRSSPSCAAASTLRSSSAAAAAASFPAAAAARASASVALVRHPRKLCREGGREGGRGERKKSWML